MDLWPRSPPLCTPPPKAWCDRCSERPSTLCSWLCSWRPVPTAHEYWSTSGLDTTWWQEGESETALLRSAFVRGDGRVLSYVRCGRTDAPSHNKWRAEIVDGYLVGTEACGMYAYGGRGSHNSRE